MHLERPVSQLVTLTQLVHNLRFTCRGGEGRDEVFMRAHVVHDRAGFDDAGPADDARDAEPAFPVRVLFAPERRAAAVGPGHDFGAVVCRIDDDGVIRNPQVVEDFSN